MSNHTVNVYHNTIKVSLPPNSWEEIKQWLEENVGRNIESWQTTGSVENSNLTSGNGWLMKRVARRDLKTIVLQWDIQIWIMEDHLASAFRVRWL